MKLQVLQALNTWKKRQFSYGDADCCQFAGFVVEQLTGQDYLESFEYNSEDVANRIISSHGDLKATVSSVLGEPTTDIKDGDPCLVQLPYGQLLGIKLGNSVVCLAKKGFVQITQENIICGWDKWKQSTHL